MQSISPNFTGVYSVEETIEFLSPLHPDTLKRPGNLALRMSAGLKVQCDVIEGAKPNRVSLFLPRSDPLVYLAALIMSLLIIIH